jgi:hypothetical protein
MSAEALISLNDERQNVKKPGNVASNSVAKPPVKGIARYA